MATYLEISALYQDAALRQRIAVACVIAAEGIRAELDTVPQHAERLAWARKVFNSPGTVADAMIWPVLAQNAGASSSAIQGSTDAQVLAAVQSAIAVFL